MAIAAFPPYEDITEDGLIAIGGDLEISSLLLAYSKGIFPWPMSQVPYMTWFCPDPRGILEFEKLHISKSMSKLMRQKKYQFKLNLNFEAVIKQCASAQNRKNEPESWISEKMIKAYTDLHRAGYAYSAETYHEDQLVGGLYGVCIGQIVSGESMFYLKSNASKFALISLMQYLALKNILWIDTQMITPIVHDLGGVEIARHDFLEKISTLQSRSSTASGSLFPTFNASKGQTS